MVGRGGGGGFGTFQCDTVPVTRVFVVVWDYGEQKLGRAVVLRLVEGKGAFLG